MKNPLERRILVKGLLAVSNVEIFECHISLVLASYLYINQNAVRVIPDVDRGRHFPASLFMSPRANDNEKDIA